MDSYRTERMNVRLYVLFLRLRIQAVHKTIKQRRREDKARRAQGEPGKR